MQYRDAINTRFLASLTHYHVIAYMVDKQESDQDLPASKYEEARSFLGKLDPSLPGFLAAYTMRDDSILPSSVFDLESKNLLQPVKFWQYVAMCVQIEGAKKFFGLMARLSVCPSSSAGLERVFSSFGLVHNKLRNRLTNARVEKLVKVYVNLREKNSKGEHTDNIEYVESLIEEALEVEN